MAAKAGAAECVTRAVEQGEAKNNALFVFMLWKIAPKLSKTSSNLQYYNIYNN